MAQPTAYVPSFDFSDFSTLNPDTPQPGVSLDAQFNAIALTTDQIRANLALIQRDDGLLANGIVTADSLSDELYAGISRAIPWATATDYEAGDLVWYSSKLYAADADHTSTTNPTIDTGNWTEILDMTATVPDVITQEAQDAADAAAASALAAEASAAGVTSIVGSISYLWAGTATGAANTLVLTPVPPMASYAVGHKLRFLVGTTNTGAVTMDTDNALGSTTIKKSIGGALVALAPGDLIAGTIAEIEYVSALAGYQLINPPTYSQGSDVASATTVNLDTTNGDYVSITGTTTITGITLAQGRERTVTFAGSLTLTHGAGLILKNKGSNILTAAGDSAVFRGEAAGVVRMVSYERASGLPTAPIGYSAIVPADFAVIGDITGNLPNKFASAQSVFAAALIKLQTSVALSGASVDITSIPSGVKRITLGISGLSTNGNSVPIVQIGDSGGIETTAYTGGGTSATATVSSVANTNGFLMGGAWTSAHILGGKIELDLIDSASNIWAVSASLGREDTAGTNIMGGRKALSATLDRIRITTFGGADTFDAGNVNISWEF